MAHPAKAMPPDSIELVKGGKANAHGGCYFSRERETYLDFVVPLADS
jgi:hypothetical protein